MTSHPARSTRPLVALLTASGVSLIGTRLSVIALPLFVLITTGSATRTGLVAFVEMTPLVLAQAAAGPITDRIGPRRVSIVSDLVSGAVMALIPILHAVDRLTFPVLLAIVGLLGLARGPGDGAKYVMVPGIAEASGQPPERVLGLEDSMSRASSILGPLGAAALVAGLGAPTAIAFDAGSFVVAALVVAVGVRPPVGSAASSADSDPAPYLRRLGSGLAFVRQDRLLRSIVYMVGTTNLLDQALSTVLVVVWARWQGGGAGLMGLVAASMGLGSVIGALTAASVGHRLPRRTTYTWSFFVVGGPRFLVLGLGAPLWVVLPVLFVGGLGAGTLNPILGAVELERVPVHLRARVMSVLTSASQVLVPFGGVVGGLLTEQFGIRAALLACAAVYTSATLMPLFGRHWREMDRRPVRDPDGFALTSADPPDPDGTTAGVSATAGAISSS
ncbi:MAG: MFS transporter [Actinomycetales bacterium]